MILPIIGVLIYSVTAFLVFNGCFERVELPITPKEDTSIIMYR